MQTGKRPFYATCCFSGYFLTNHSLAMLDDYNKIIESLNIKFIRAHSMEVIRPVKITNFYDVQNNLILINTGTISLDEEEQGEPGSILFIPGGKSTPVIYGYGQPEEVTNDKFLTYREDYIRTKSNQGLVGNKSILNTERTACTVITFDVKAFDSVNFFTSLDIPPFIIRENRQLVSSMRKVYDESTHDHPGKQRMITLQVEQLIIELFRHILFEKMFVEQLATNSNYFKDPRLIDIFNYIKDNLSGDLSNKVLASVANVSEDYVGQYFKMLTGINPQDYIEYQRMEKAVDLLRTSKKSIRAIGSEVGYKDTAYFCRRFKMMFGIPAGKMRKRENIVGVDEEEDEE